RLQSWSYGDLLQCSAAVTSFLARLRRSGESRSRYPTTLLFGLSSPSQDSGTGWMSKLLSELTSAEGLTALADPHSISLTTPRAASTIYHETANFYHERL